MEESLESLVFNSGSALAQLELAALQEAVAMLDTLHSAGVDNWDGYEDALEVFN